MLALRDRNFRLLWAANLISGIGDWLLVIAIPVHVYRETGSAAATGLVYASQNLPAVLVGPFAGLVVDRVDRRRLAVMTDAARALLLPCMALAAWKSMLLLLLVGAVAERLIAQLHDPAATALVPNLVGTGDELTSANAAFGVSSAVVRLAAAPFGGLLFATFGLLPLLVIDAATFLVAAFAVAAIAPWDPSPPDRTSRTSVMNELAGGFRFVWGHERVRWLTGAMSVFLFWNGALTGLLVPFTVRSLGGNSSTFGLILSALGAGYLVGAAVTRRATASVALEPAVVAALSAIGVGFVTLSRSVNIPMAMAGAAIAGIGGAVALVVASTELQREAPDQARGRVSTAVNATQQAAQVVGTGAGAVIVTFLSLNTAVTTVSTAVLATAFAAHLTRPKLSISPPA